jgi:LTXXQ motif family protein
MNRPARPLHARVNHGTRFVHAHAGAPQAGLAHNRNNPLHPGQAGHPLVGGHQSTAAARVRPLPHAADLMGFAGRREFSENAAFSQFWHRGWHPYHHLGWVGPVFWPYAYGDFFYYALWPDDYGYFDPFWAYGYGDIYEAMFSPYDYSEYVEGPAAPNRMATLAQTMAHSCAEEAAEVTGWPINQIQATVQPNQRQSAMLDDLGKAIVKASDEIDLHCPITVAFTATDRLAQMHERLRALVEAVNIISPPLDAFYGSLSDEQKARFNDIAPTVSHHEQVQGEHVTPSLAAQCDPGVMAFPTDQIDRAVRPDDAQRVKLNGLRSAAAEAADIVKATCPSRVPVTPPSRLAAIGKRLQATLQAVDTVRLALADFYDSLTDDQKARFNTVGPQLFAGNGE